MSPYAPFQPYINRKEFPQELVCHTCSLESLIKPLWQTVETQVEGLKLAEYLPTRQE